MFELPIKRAPRPTGRWRVNSPFFQATTMHGCRSYEPTSYAQCGVFLFPSGFDDPEREYWALVDRVVMWEVPDERPIEVRGPDAARFMEILVTRRVAHCDPGSCRYVLLTDSAGGLINDTIVFRLSGTRFWLAADLGWVKGVAAGSNFIVEVEPAAAFPIQVQGPRSPAVMTNLFGGQVADLKRFRFQTVIFRDMPLLVSRTGWSGELGYEIFLCSFDRATELWEAVLNAGLTEGIIAIGSSEVRRVEAGFLSANVDYSIYETPFDVGLGDFVDLDKPEDFIGKPALQEAFQTGSQNRLISVISDDPLETDMGETWPALVGQNFVGVATTLVRSPRSEKSIGFVLLDSAEDTDAQELTVKAPWGDMRFVTTSRPFVPHATG